jgi:hypothetical protein
MTPEESKLYGEAVHALAMVIFNLQEREACTLNVNGQQVQVHPPYFYHYSMSLLERASEILWKLHILRPINEQNNWATVFKFECDLGEVARIAIENAKNGPMLNSVLDNFIAIRSENNRLHVDHKLTFCAAGQTLFTIGEKEVPLFETLTALNYVSRAVDGYVASGLSVDLPAPRPSKPKTL